MSGHPPTGSPSSHARSERERLVEDLESRIDQLESLDESEIGAFTRLDWFLCVVGSVVIPAIALWWFAE